MKGLNALKNNQLYMISFISCIHCRVGLKDLGVCRIKQCLNLDISTVDNSMQSNRGTSLALKVHFKHISYVPLFMSLPR